MTTPLRDHEEISRDFTAANARRVYGPLEYNGQTRLFSEELMTSAVERLRAMSAARASHSKTDQN
jgi:hypothetical protein